MPQDLVAPMLVTPGSLPSDADDSRYAYETKWDGLRAVAYLHGPELTLRNRNGADITPVYPELAGLAEAVGATEAVLDGEIIATDRQGQVDFGALQPRMHLRNATQIKQLAATHPVSYRIFDLMRLDGRDVTALPYTERRGLLEQLVPDGERWAVSAYTVGNGAAHLADSARAGQEGIVAKRLDAPYLPGRRSPVWLKIKNIRTQEVVVGGWTEGAGNRAGTIGSLLLGIPEGRVLRYVGHVGTGFTREVLAELEQLLHPLARTTSPFAEALPTREAKGAHWVTPKLVGEVAFAEWTRDQRLRQPAWRGLRTDKTKDQVVRES